MVFIKTTKRIIIRIIVAVAVAVILSKLKLIGILNVSALASVQDTARDITAFYNFQDTNGVTYPLAQTTIFRSSYRVNQFTQQYNDVQSISFNFSPNSTLYNYKWNLAFNFYSLNFQSGKFDPFRIYIRDNNENITYCKISDTNQFVNTTGGTGLTSYINTVVCENFQVSGAYQVYIVGPFSVSSNSQVGISTLHFIRTSEEELLSRIYNELANQNSTQQQIADNTKETNDLIKNDDTSSASSSGSSFFNNFDASIPGGLSGVITAPLSFIQSLTSKQCSPLQLNLGIVNKQFSLPCATTFMQQNFSDLLSFYQLVTHGLVGYLILIKIFSLVKDFKNPDSDKIEVLDL